MAQIYNSIKTTLPKVLGLNRTWYIVDASKEPVGRMATKIARLLMGKNRADFNPGIDMGGCVVVINSDKLVFTGKKPDKKVYFRYDNGRPGSLKHRYLKDQMVIDSTKPIYLAVKRMLPKNRLQDVRMNTRLHILKGETHKFTQQLVAA